MGGWFLDIWIGYLVSLVMIGLRKRRVRHYKSWPETMATIVGVSWQEQFWMERPVGELVYTYHLDGGFYGGVDRKPFCFKSSAEIYASQFAKGDMLVIRTKPGEPGLSVLLDEDQKNTRRPNQPV